MRVAGAPSELYDFVAAVLSMDLAGKLLAVAIVFATSWAAVFLPVTATLPAWALFIARHAGSGVLLATALMHLLEPAADALTNPRLGGFWQEFPCAYALCLVMIFVVFFADLMSKRRLARLGGLMEHHEALTIWPRRHDDHELGKPLTVSAHTGDAFGARERSGSQNGTASPYGAGAGAGGAGGSGGGPYAPVAGPRASDESARSSATHVSTGEHDEPERGGARGGARASPVAQMSSLVILEAGIVVHSLFIGLSVAIAKDEALPLAVAVTLHQTFEGLGLGARLAAVPWPADRRWMPRALGWLYAVTTPVGILLGLALVESYDPESVVALVLSGVSDALSAGVLLYTGLVELLGNEILHAGDLATAPLADVLTAFLSALFGAALMALMALWI